jgi:uncharacterized protein
MTIKPHLTLLLFLLITSSINGESILEKPVPNRYVNDYANLLSETEETYLETQITSHYQETSNQIAVVILQSLEGHQAADLAHRLAEKWGVGQAGKNNGVLILVKPKYQHEKGQVYIAVGYGLEGLIPDAVAKRIVEDLFIPHFKSEQYYQGLNKGIVRIIQLIKGEYTYDLSPWAAWSRHKIVLISLLLITLILPFLYLFYLRKRRVSDELSPYYIQGQYNAENVVAQVERIEKAFDKKYPKLKKQIRKYESASRNKLIKYAHRIDQTLFCHLLNGRERGRLFWQMADPFLKGIIVYLVILLVGVSVSVLIENGVLGLLLGLFVSSLVFYALMSFLQSFIEMQQYVLRRNAKYLGGTSVALFALNTVLKKNIDRRFDHATQSYVYYPHIVYGSIGSGGSFGGSGFGGSGFGGFGGGSFGGGGAGGSW